MRAFFLYLFLFLLSIKQEVFAQKEELKEEKIYTVAEKMPKYIGGDRELLKFLKDNLVYPEQALERKIEGIVFIKLIINKKGKIKDPKVFVSVDALLDQEAIRLVKKMPKWEPAYQNDKPVSIYYNLPVRFKLSEQRR